MIWNIILQVVLLGFMWGMNRYDCLLWLIGLFVVLVCVVVGIGGYIMFFEGKKVKGQEGVLVSEKDFKWLEQDCERGIYYYNNMKDKDFEVKKVVKVEKVVKKQVKKEVKKSSFS